jgi:catechol 2,3-dioxygenase-like lactoylglutathione lyase family enzyme
MERGPRPPEPNGSAACPIRSRRRVVGSDRPFGMEATVPAKLGVIGIVVDDMARSLAFYRLLGLDVPPDADGQPHVEATLPGGLGIAWDTVETIHSFDPGWKPGDGRGRIGLAFRLDTPAAVDAAYAEIVSRGYSGHLTPFDAFWGQRYASVLDPDGNAIDLYAPSE